jgi:hypothetical protein
MSMDNKIMVWISSYELFWPQLIQVILKLLVEHTMAGVPFYALQ